MQNRGSLFFALFHGSDFVAMAPLKFSPPKRRHLVAMAVLCAFGAVPARADITIDTPVVTTVNFNEVTQINLNNVSLVHGYPGPVGDNNTYYSFEATNRTTSSKLTVALDTTTNLYSIRNASTTSGGIIGLSRGDVEALLAGKQITQDTNTYQLFVYGSVTLSGTPTPGLPNDGSSGTTATGTTSSVSPGRTIEACRLRLTITAC